MPDTQIRSRDVSAAVSDHLPSTKESFGQSDGLWRALLYPVSHDPPTPLTGIRAIAAALRSADVDWDLRDAMLADLDDEAERLSRLLASLLEAPRIEAGALRLRSLGCPVTELCHAAIHDARAALGRPPR
jgi:K+-sensing histidine kinase KdpD